MWPKQHLVEMIGQLLAVCSCRGVPQLMLQGYRSLAAKYPSGCCLHCPRRDVTLHVSNIMGFFHTCDMRELWLSL